MFALAESWFDRLVFVIAECLRRANRRGTTASAAALGAGKRTPCTGHDLDGIADEQLARLRVACRA